MYVLNCIKFEQLNKLDRDLPKDMETTRLLLLAIVSLLCTVLGTETHQNLPLNKCRCNSNGTYRGKGDTRFEAYTTAAAKCVDKSVPGTCDRGCFCVCSNRVKFPNPKKNLAIATCTSDKVVECLCPDRATVGEEEPSMEPEMDPEPSPENSDYSDDIQEEDMAEDVYNEIMAPTTV